LLGVRDRLVDGRDRLLDGRLALSVDWDLLGLLCIASRLIIHRPLVLVLRILVLRRLE
jgi:hypothetical protein